MKEMDFASHHPTNRMFRPSEQYQSPSHYQRKVEPNAKEDSYRRRDDCTNTASGHQYSTGRLHKKIYERKHQTIEPSPSNGPSQVKWCRNNIAMTMEYFEPISSTSTPKSYSNDSDYSYAYYEPGAVMRHSNIPKMPATTTANPPSNDQSTRTSPKSIRSLLSKPNDDKTKPNNRHIYTTRYGTQENIYEDVSSIRLQPDREASRQSLDERGGSKIEFQDILHNHYRVLEELNLSVEEMLLSTTTKSSALLPRNMLKRSTKSRTKTKKNETSSFKNLFASSLNTLVVGEDSGFSGSSSGASYIGSLRNYKTALTRSRRNSTEIDQLNNVRDCGRLQDVRISNELRQPQTMNEELKGDKCSGPTKVLKFPFWKKK